MKNCLILLTKRYPYSSGEPFLESEITHHIPNFDKIVVLAQDMNRGDAPTRQVPGGVDIFNIAKRSKAAGRVSDLVSAAVHIPINTQARKAEKAAVAGSPARRLFLEYFEARSRRQFAETIAALRSFDFSAFNQIVIYSYWFFVTARVGMMLKDYFVSGTPAEIKLYTRGHGYDVYENRNKLAYLPMRPTILESVDKAFICSEDGAAHLREKYPLYSAKIETSFLGTADCGIGNPPAGYFHIVSVSKTIPVKRVERILSSLTLLKDSGIALKWTHIGGGKGLENVKKAAADKLGFMQTCFLGILPNKEVLEFYRRNPVSLFVNSSSSEGLPVSIMEAMSFGIPAVATDVGGTGEIVSDNRSGVLLSHDFRDQELAAAIKRFARMPAKEYGEFRNNSRRIWEAKFNAQENYARFSAVISK